jgi:GNAT superfamily N-acetyltransferase
MGEGMSRTLKADKKASLQNYVNNKTPVGLLAYYDDEPVAWCSVAPRESYRQLGGDDTLQNVWSIACFFVKRGHRGKGMMNAMIDEAKKYAKKYGGEYLEAYPVHAESHSYRFMGFTDVFEKAGFEFVKMAGQRRHVMVVRL